MNCHAGVSEPAVLSLNEVEVHKLHRNKRYNAKENPIMSEAPTPSYAFTVALDVPFERAREQVVDALKAEGFGVLTEIDVKSTMKQKIDVDFRKYAILGVCNPNLAHRALNIDLQMGLLLPCTAIVYEEDDGSVVSLLDPSIMREVAANPALEPVAEEARARLRRAIEALGG